MILMCLHFTGYAGAKARKYGKKQLFKKNVLNADLSVDLMVFTVNLYFYVICIHR